MQRFVSGKTILFYLLLAAILTVALFFRFWHINFGLPHSFYADEPEFAELAIKYTYEIRDIIQNNNYYKLIPVSYVYGTFPVYLLTPITMLWSKLSNIIGNPVEKMDLYVAMRGFTALVSTLILPLAAFLYYKIFKSKIGAIITFLLLALNWKLIVHAHYVNADIILTVLIIASLVTATLYIKKDKDSLFTLLTGILFGLSVGTKITAGISAPIFLYLFASKKDYRGVFAFIFIAFTAFAATNPFSLIFANNFAFRIYSMLTQEAGLVFDSANASSFKYVTGLSDMLTPIVLILSVAGIFMSLRKKVHPQVSTLLLGHILIYFVFYTIQLRRVDRWLLPTVPIFIMYASYFLFTLLKDKKHQLIGIILSVATILWVSYYPTLLLGQFQRNTPRSAAYIWLRDNTPKETSKFVISEEGMDPMGKLFIVDIQRAPVYVSENAQYERPSPTYYLYDYVIISSRAMEYYKNDLVKEEYPFFYKSWAEFESELNSGSRFDLIKTFEVNKPNLIPLSDIYIYKNNSH